MTEHDEANLALARSECAAFGNLIGTYRDGLKEFENGLRDAEAVAAGLEAAVRSADIEKRPQAVAELDQFMPFLLSLRVVVIKARAVVDTECPKLEQKLIEAHELVRALEQRSDASKRSVTH